jgi:hypothetical protein
MPKLKTLLFTAAVVVIPFMLSACGPDLETPEGAAEALFDAYRSVDEEAAQEVVCETYQDYDIINEDGYDEIQFSSDLDFEVKDVPEQNRIEGVDGDQKLIRAYGSMRLQYEINEIETDQRFRSQGDEPLVEFIVIKEGDEWRVCDDSAFLLQ